MEILHLGQVSVVRLRKKILSYKSSNSGVPIGHRLEEKRLRQTKMNILKYQ